MKKIFKYELEVKDFQVLKLPRHSELLTVQMQGSHICLWAIVNTDEGIPQSGYQICIVGTGNEC